MSETPPPIAVAVLLVGGRYALQHRDDIAGIAWPGHWGLFGGVVEDGETALVAVEREIMEEIGLGELHFALLWSTTEHRDFWGRRRDLSVFEADVTAVWSTHRLGEGQGVGVFAADALPSPLVPVAGRMIERHAQRLG